MAAIWPLSAAGQSTVGEAIDALVAGGVDPVSNRTMSPRYREWMETVYGIRNRTPAWFTSDGARPAIATALVELRAADARGLEPGNYDVDLLEREIATATAVGGSPEHEARADVALTLTMLRFLADLRVGRIPAHDVLPYYRAPARNLDFVASLRAAVAANTLSSAIDAAEPSFPLYGRLKRELAHYRRLAAQPFAALPPLPKAAAKVEAAGTYAGTRALHERLVLLGDLPASSTMPADDRYSNDLAEGVARFQDRHGLKPDGILGKQTLAELNVPLAARIRQIELSLERLRWLPQFPPGPLIAVNIPSFQLWAFTDLPASDRPTLTMAVIVGRAMRTQTPVFIGEMRYLEFSPYWNVPPSILRAELLSELARDGAYLARHDMEMVPATGGGAPVTAVDDTTLAALRSGQLRVRQRPGGRNALGGVKFVLPNTMDIYLHGTPARELFGRTRRDFSHGCIRLADPTALTQFVLRDQPDWSIPRIEAAMSSGTMSTVKLTTPVPVIVFYTTAIVGNDGRASFLPDVYGHDRELEIAMQRGRLR